MSHRPDRSAEPPARRRLHLRAVIALDLAAWAMVIVAALGFHVLSSPTARAHLLPRAERIAADLHRSIGHGGVLHGLRAAMRGTAAGESGHRA